MAKKVGIKIELDEKGVVSGFTKIGNTAQKSLGKISTGATKATGALKNFGSGLFSIKGAIAGLGVGILVKKFTDLTIAQAKLQDETIKTSRAVGTSVETLQSLRRSAELGGASVESLDNGMKRLSRNIYDASNGVGEAKKAFNDLGISVVDSNGKLKSSDDIINEIADSFSKMEDGTKKNAQAQLLFGRSGGELINTLNGGSEALKKQREEAERLGLIFDKEASENAEKFNDTLLDLQKTFESTFRDVANDLLPELTETMKDLTEWTAKNRDNIADYASKAIDTFTSLVAPAKVLLDVVLKSAEGYGMIADGIERISQANHVEEVAKLAKEQYEVTKELKEQEAILEKFEQSGFIPPSILDNVNALDSKLFAIKGRLEELQVVSSEGGEPAEPAEKNAIEKEVIKVQNEEFRSTELSADIEYMRQQAEAQRAFEVKKWGIKTEFWKKNRTAKENERIADKITADAELKNRMAVADASIRLGREVFGENKLLSLAEIGMSTARGIMSALGSTPPNPILAGIIGATGAVQSAKVSGLKLADGGVVEGIGTNRSDSIPAMLSNGESVLNQPATQTLGADGVNALNSGASIGGNVTVNVTAGAGADGESIAQMVVNALYEAKQRGLEPSIV